MVPTAGCPRGRPGRRAAGRAGIGFLGAHDGRAGAARSGGVPPPGHGRRPHDARDAENRIRRYGFGRAGPLDRAGRHGRDGRNARPHRHHGRRDDSRVDDPRWAAHLASHQRLAGGIPGAPRRGSRGSRRRAAARPGRSRGPSVARKAQDGRVGRRLAVDRTALDDPRLAGGKPRCELVDDDNFCTNPRKSKSGISRTNACLRAVGHYCRGGGGTPYALTPSSAPYALLDDQKHSPAGIMPHRQKDQ
jgi:hypothetical protein